MSDSSSDGSVSGDPADWCWWCRFPPAEGHALFRLKRREAEAGYFCTPSCAKAWLLDARESDMYQMIADLQVEHGGGRLVWPAPPRAYLRPLGGFMTIEQFREHGVAQAAKGAAQIDNESAFCSTIRGRRAKRPRAHNMAKTNAQFIHAVGDAEAEHGLYADFVAQKRARAAARAAANDERDKRPKRRPTIPPRPETLSAHAEARRGALRQTRMNVKKAADEDVAANPEDVAETPETTTAKAATATTAKAATATTAKAATALQPRRSKRVASTRMGSLGAFIKK
jgi:hypothetical protein